MPGPACSSSPVAVSLSDWAVSFSLHHDVWIAVSPTTRVRVSRSASLTAQGGRDSLYTTIYVSGRLLCLLGIIIFVSYLELCYFFIYLTGKKCLTLIFIPLFLLFLLISTLNDLSFIDFYVTIYIYKGTLNKRSVFIRVM